MEYRSDIEIARSAAPADILDIGRRAGIRPEYLECYGRNKAKIDFAFLDEKRDAPDGKLILVTAMTPTAAGEGKTTTSVGLADGLRKIGRRAAVALREPSLGPVFGSKGGAAGGGLAQVVPMEDINLHFTGDIHAVTAANNLLAAMIDNHIYHGNAPDIDPGGIFWRRCLDVNDRQLREIEEGFGGRLDKGRRRDGFDISAASEIMAVLCLAENPADLKARLGRIVVGCGRDGAPVTAASLRAAGALAVLLKDALKPNLVQTLEGTPALVHGGPFANIAHGCNSVIATKTALKCADYVVTEAGFGADLGAEKFIDIKCRAAGIVPSAAVLVATVRALKLHGGADRGRLTEENDAALRSGMENLARHIENITDVYGLPAVVAVNRFPADRERELDMIGAYCEKAGVRAVVSEAFTRGGEGAALLAEEVVRLSALPNAFRFVYDASESVERKIEEIAKRVYRADGVILTDRARRQIDWLTAGGFSGLPVCIAKTQYSFSDDAKLPGAPRGFRITVRDLKLSAGAGFIVALAGSVMTMPGLPKRPAAEAMDIDEKGTVAGLF